MSENCTIMEIVADYIYFVIIGNKEDLVCLSKLFRQYNDINNISKTYIITRLDIPISYKYEVWENEFNKKIVFDYGIESAQSYAIAQEQFIFSTLKGSKHNLSNTKEPDLNEKYMLLILESDNIIHFPKLDLHDDDDPEEIILSWINKIIGHIPDKIKKTIKPISLVGYNDDILVYIANIS